MKYPKQQAALYSRIEKDAKILDILFSGLIDNIARTIYNVSGVALVDYVLKSSVNSYYTQFQRQVETIIVNGIKREWQASNNNTDTLVKKILGDDADEKYLRNNQNALDEFLSRKQSGMNLSTRVWNIVNDTKSEIEKAIEDGLDMGDSAISLSKQLKDKVLNKPGTVNPGQGVYRDPRKNAKRLARTEINMAYKSADYERWQQLDFVIGIEVHLSNNPHHCTVCESLQGKYPKDFKFISWHPQCRCFAVPIMDHEEGAKKVTEPNTNFNIWIEGNIDRVKGYRQLPYFIADNSKYIKSNGRKVRLVDNRK